MNTGHKLNKSTRLWIIQLWKIKTDREIAAILGCKATKIARMRARMGLYRFRKNSTPEQRLQTLEDERLELVMLENEEAERVRLANEEIAEREMERKMAKAMSD